MNRKINEMSNNFQDDSQLVEFLINRDDTSVNEIQKKYNNYLYSIVLRILKNQEDADECINDILLKIWETIPPNIPKSLKAYIGTMTRNTALDFYRKINSQKRNPMFTEILEECQEVILNSDNVPEKYIENKEISNSINTYLEKITKTKRLIFIGRYYYGYSTSELGTKYKLSDTNIRSILYRMRKDLKKQLEKDGVLL